MKPSTKFFATIFILTLSVTSYSQIGISNYSFSVLSFNTNNFKAKDYHRFSLGLGLNAYPFIGYDHVAALTLPLQWEVFPLQQFKRFSMLYELSGMLVVEDAPILRNLFGIKYAFGNGKGGNQE